MFTDETLCHIEHVLHQRVEAALDALTTCSPQSGKYLGEHIAEMYEGLRFIHEELGIFFMNAGDDRAF